MTVSCDIRLTSLTEQQTLPRPDVNTHIQFVVNNKLKSLNDWPE